MDTSSRLSRNVLCVYKHTYPTCVSFPFLLLKYFYLLIFQAGSMPSRLQSPMPGWNSRPWDHDLSGDQESDAQRTEPPRHPRILSIFIQSCDLACRLALGSFVFPFLLLCRMSYPLHFLGSQLLPHHTMCGVSFSFFGFLEFVVSVMISYRTENTGQQMF